MDKKSKNWILPAILLVVGLVIGYLFVKSDIKIPVGSVTVGNEYNSTTTPVSGYASKLLKGGYGALGSVVITGSGTNAFDLLNATTSDITKRASTKTTSSLILARFPASVATGTYTFDITFTDGLLLDVTTAGTGTTTITYR